MGFATPRTGLAAVDGCLLAALHWEEHSVDPTVLEKSLDLVIGHNLCAHARALHFDRCSPQGRRHGGRCNRSIPTWCPPSADECMECTGAACRPYARSWLRDNVRVHQ